MTSGSRMPTWKERENNKRRERRRRAIAAKIFSGLRMYGNYKLPKHCDNNEVLKALCDEAGWIVEEDGTTYRKGCKPIGSAVVSACTSNQPSPRTSVNPSPVFSSFASPVSNHCNYNVSNTADPNSLIPWLKNLSSGSCPDPSKFPHYLYVPGGSISAPVTPPLSSPTAHTPRMKDDPTSGSFWPGLHYPFPPYSTTQSPGTQTPPDSGWLSGVQTPQDGHSSPTFSLVSPNPFTFKEPLSNGGSRMWTPGQSGTCSPIVAPGIDQTADVPMCDAISAEFAFGSNNTMGVVKAWEGERIHDECVPDDLELTLGNSGTR
ncbi:BES1/BZR1 homolog protein 4-like [Primulina huaijiensis]|uniref:BES1/BZR1 homolog protein 4-like n=1 Tax=Primulina huaijiensis TaxID=1492673 RepID=UPI003CC735E6